MYPRYKNKEHRKEYQRLWRIKNRKRLNEYLKNYLIRTGKNYAKENASQLVCLHNWIEKMLGTPMRCSICGTTKKRRYQWSNIDHKYTKDLEKWQRLCPTCHREYDRKYNGTKTYLEK